ncbi:GNAT family N-acetyltransferase [Paracoccus tegillarcae]|uniref:Drug:proton antiporter n=1 Tax=Paracoccus tegillarcae TaxID=1529068 RepID=A0A2K9EXG3_9RHOB|nr:GNAT family N-acetyltransferase [Paracoccus tegillarcae]AUH32762.1 drug:proton antiporter [Paracoccus tegillarcae]
MRIELTEDIAACHAIRRAVFIDEQGIDDADEWDDLDEKAVHLLAWQDGEPVGTARILLKGSIGRIGRICVMPEARGTGLGRMLLKASMDVLRSRQGISQAMLSAQVQAIGFYQKLGFEVAGDVYDDAGIAHQEMIRDL